MPPSTIRGWKLGIHSIRFEIDQKPLRSIKLKVLLNERRGQNLTNKVGLGISVNSFTYFATLNGITMRDFSG